VVDKFALYERPRVSCVYHALLIAVLSFCQLASGTVLQILLYLCFTTLDRRYLKCTNPSLACLEIHLLL
jgi:hypothetical protein